MSNNSTTCSPRETFFLILTLLTNRIFTNLPLVYTRISGTGAPLSALLSGIAAAILIYFSVRIFSQKKGNILSICENIFGRWGKIILSLLLTGYLFLSAFYLLTEITDFTKLIAFPTTPFWFVAVFFVLAALMGAVGGGQTLFRSVGFIICFFLLSLLIITLSVLFRSDFTNLFPLLGTGASNTLAKGFYGTAMYGDIILLFLLKPTFPSAKSARRTVIGASAAAILINILVIIAYTAKIPYPVSAQEHFPAYLLLKEAYFGRFFQRMDAIFLLSSALCGMFSLSLNLFLISVIFRETFGIAPRRIVLFPVTIPLYFIGIANVRPSAQLISLSALIITAAIVTLTLLPGRKERSIRNET